MEGIEFKTFAELSGGRWMYCCNCRFLFHMWIAKYQLSILKPLDINIYSS
jgi:hypothetical protein